jgi:hypothetical protein
VDLPPTSEAENVRLGRVQRRDAEREAIAAFNREAGGLYEALGVAAEVTATGQPRPGRGVGRPLKRAPRRRGRGDVLEEPQFASGAKDAVQLGERRHDVADRAQHH